MRTVFISLTVLATASCGAVPVTPGPKPTLQSAVDACANLFVGPQYDVPWGRSPEPRAGQPATLAGAAESLCTQSGSCYVRTFLPAGSDPDTGEAWFISRVEHEPLPFDPVQCPSIDYFLVVVRGGKITRTSYLVATGNSCMHWRDEQITVGNSLFVWRDSGFGAPIADYDVWERRSMMQFDLATLRVNGCVTPTIEPTVPILRHPFG